LTPEPGANITHRQPMVDQNTHGLKGGPLEVLFERAGLTTFDLPAELVASYGGGFGLPRPRLFANFVASVDGTVALRQSGDSGHVISGDNEADRFVMGVLRACADAILVGAGTFRASKNHLWHAEQIFPSAKAQFAEFRRKQQLSPQPKFVLLTQSGEVDPGAPALADALILTTAAGDAKLRGTLPASARIVVLDAPIRLSSALELLHHEGFELVLTEGGPSLMGKLLAEDLVDELFVTISPRLFGQSLGDGRKSLVHGVELNGTPLELLSARRQASHLFLRYAVGGR
jgi:riboflavin biosynthesis pyrimidine reductase